MKMIMKRLLVGLLCALSFYTPSFGNMQRVKATILNNIKRVEPAYDKAVTAFHHYVGVCLVLGTVSIAALGAEIAIGKISKKNDLELEDCSKVLREGISAMHKEVKEMAAKAAIEQAEAECRAITKSHFE